jgi:hypothetical protein
MQTCISSLRNAVDVQLASRLYHKLSHLNAPRFAAHRLHLPCIVFPVKEVKWSRGEDQQLHSTFAVSFRGQDPLGKFSCSSIHEIVRFLRCRTLQTLMACPMRRAWKMGHLLSLHLPDGPPRIWGFGMLLVRVAVDGPHRTAFQCYFSGAAVGRTIPEDCIRSEYHSSASQKHGFYSPHDRSVQTESIALSCVNTSGNSG